MSLSRGRADGPRPAEELLRGTGANGATNSQCSLNPSVPWLSRQPASSHRQCKYWDCLKFLTLPLNACTVLINKTLRVSGVVQTLLAPQSLRAAALAGQPVLADAELWCCSSSSC